MRHPNNLMNAVFVLLVIVAILPFVNPSETSAASRFSKLLGFKVHYEIVGDGSPTLVFIHGWACDRTVWRYQIPEFAKKSSVIAIDLPGHGKSDKPEADYSIPFFADAVSGVLADAEVEEAVLIGHSMGYAIARDMIKRHVGKINALCIVDGAYYRIPTEPKALAEWNQSAKNFLKGFYSENRKAFVDNFMESFFVPGTPKAIKDAVKAMVAKTPVEVQNSAMTCLHNPAVWDEKQLKLPVLAVYAESSDLPPDNEVYLRYLYPNLTYFQWKDVGHYLMMERPEAFNELLKAFLYKQ